MPYGTYFSSNHHPRSLLLMPKKRGICAETLQVKSELNDIIRSMRLLFDNSRLDYCDRAEEIGSLTPTIVNSRHGSDTWKVAFSPDGNYFVWTSGRFLTIVPWSDHVRNVKRQHSEGLINVQDSEKIDCGEVIHSVAVGRADRDYARKHRQRWSRFHFSEIQVLAVGLHSGKIKLYNLESGKFMCLLMDHKDTIGQLHFSPHGTLQLASASRDQTIKLWDLHDDGNMYKTLKHEARVYSFAWSPDGSILASCGAGKTVIMWSVISFTIIYRLEGHHNNVVECCFSPDGALLATASYDTRVGLWSVGNGHMIMSLGHLFPPPSLIFASGQNDGWVRSVAFSSNGVHLASVADDGFMRIWNLLDQDEPEQVAEIDSGTSLKFHPSGKFLALGTRSGKVSFFHTPEHVTPLRHLCRLTIRSQVTLDKIPCLTLPKALQDYLSYLTL